jgi:hypothetical protein
VTNDNEQVIVNSNEMVIEEENVLHDLNLEIKPQLMVNNSITPKKKPKHSIFLLKFISTLIRPNSNCKTSLTVGSTNTAG